MKRELVVGMEIHVELRTKSKMFCGCPGDHFSVPPNTHTCPVCLGMPGALPVPNKVAIEWAARIGLALNCQVNNQSKFDRKHYFYPDLPKGYQISQYDEPLCSNGFIDTTEGKIRITRVHLEEDTGKLQHSVIKGERVTLVDFNRSGVPLVEIVTEPDIKSSSQAKEYAQKLQQIIRFLGVSDADMEKGSMRLEANISLRSSGVKELPDYKVEVKNLNSFKFVEKAIEYESARQALLLDKGTLPAQETRGWSESQGKTVSQRSKETSEDYRYFPDPDIPPITFTGDDIVHFKASMPDLPNDYLKILTTTYNVRSDFAALLVTDPQKANFTLDCLKASAKTGIKPDVVVKYLVNKPVNFSGSLDTVLDKLKSMVDKPSVSQADMVKWVKESLDDNPDIVAKFEAGKTSVIGALVGDVKRRSKGQADAGSLNKLIFDALQAKSEK